MRAFISNGWVAVALVAPALLIPVVLDMLSLWDRPESRPWRTLLVLEVPLLVLLAVVVVERFVWLSF